ncbi:MAG: cation:proton antiporter [Flavipsychrobacter sp.]|nr:cation:proton antiporter [Flavipsychrobacter sp.]
MFPLAAPQVHEALSHPLAVFLLQLITIIVAAQLCGWAMRRIGQPAVMGEILAGILLGPSFVGALFPAFNAFVFPPASLHHLQMLSQVGLVLFMFVIGMELDLSIIRKKARSAMLISNISIVVPYALGVLLSFVLYERYCPPGIPFHAFALFIGIALSITAFPVLARIIRERGLAQTRMGSIAIISAAWGDIAGWCILAVVIAIVKASSVSSSVVTLGLAAAYVLVMLLVVRPFLKKLSTEKTNDRQVKRSTIALIFVVLLASAYGAEVAGIHALFGAFMAGVIMPLEWNFRHLIISKIEDVALVMLLPIFFIFTGLRTQIGLLSNPSLWAVCLLITLVAIAGKLGGSALAARIAGESAHDSLAIGALMNTRGLMELIILNIGLDLGILSQEIFAMMVIMALVTTFMTSPLLSLLERVYGKAKE